MSTQALGGSAPSPALDSLPQHERPELGTILVLARKELRDAVRDKWLWLYTGGFILVAVSLTSLTNRQTDTAGFEEYGRSAASLISLVQLLVPLIGLTLGARSIVGSKERGTLAFLLSHPVSRTEVFLGTYLGSVAALLTAIAGGFGAVGLIAGLRSSGVPVGRFVYVALLSWLLAASMVGIGMIISVASKRTSSAMGTALFAWLVIVVLGDLGLMGTSAAMRLPTGTLFVAAVVSPSEAFRLTAIHSLHGSLDTLGPVGAYSVDRFGDSLPWLTGGSLALWTVLAVLVGLLFFRRRADA